MVEAWQVRLLHLHSPLVPEGLEEAGLGPPEVRLKRGDERESSVLRQEVELEVPQTDRPLQLEEGGPVSRQEGQHGSQVLSMATHGPGPWEVTSVSQIW